MANYYLEDIADEEPGYYLEEIDEEKRPSVARAISEGLGEYEAALAAVSGALSWIPSGIVKAAGLVSGQLPEATELGDEIQQALTYEPRSERGKRLAGYVTKPFEMLAEGAQEFGDWAYEKTDSPFVGAAAKTAVESVPFVAPLLIAKGIRGAKGKTKPTATEPEAGRIPDKPPEVLGESYRMPEEVMPERPKMGGEEIPPKPFKEVKTDIIERKDYILEPIEEVKVAPPQAEIVEPGAAAGGKQVTVWHGSKNAMVEGFDPSLEGTGIVSQGQKYGGTFFTSSKENAGFFADYKDLPKKISVDDLNVYGDAKGGYHYLVDQGGNSIINHGPFKTEGAAEIAGGKAVTKYNEKMARGEDMFVTPWELKPVNPMEATGAEVTAAGSMTKLAKQAKDAGHDALIVRDYQDGSHVSDIYVAFDKNIIKAPAPLPEVGLKAKAVTPEIPKAAEILGEGKESRLAIRAEADAIEAKLTQDFGKLTEYDPMTMKEQASRAAEVIGKDYEAAKRMAMGAEKPPEGIREATMYEAVKIRAIKEGDVDLLRGLATESTVPKRLSEYGQEIKAADSRIMEDPVKVMQDVAKTRAEKALRTGQKIVPPEEVAKLSQRVTDLETQLAGRRAAKTVKQIENEVLREARQTKRVYAKEELAAEFDGFVKDLNKQLGGQLSAGIDPTAALILGKMAKNRVQSGIITVEGLVDSIYTSAKNAGIELSKRDIMEAISGYGKWTKLEHTQVLDRLREIKGEMQQVLKLDDLQTKGYAEKTGRERQAKSDEYRRLEKQVNEYKKKYGIQDVDPETKLQSSLGAVKTRLTNQIADLEVQIATREKIVKDKTEIAYDAEALSLKDKRDTLKKEYDKIFKEPKRTPEQIALKSLKTRMKNEESKLTRNLDNLEFAKQERRTIELDPEAIKLKAARDQAKKNYDTAAKSTHTITREEAARIVELSSDLTTKKAKYNPQTRTWPTREVGLEYGAAKVAWERYVDELKGANESVAGQIKARLAEAKNQWKQDSVKASIDLVKDSAKTIADNSVVMAGSYDLSFAGRQGGFTFLTHPTAWYAGAKKMSSGFVKEFGSGGAMDAYLADVYSRPNYMDGQYKAAKLTSLTEEVYPTDLLERTPVIGKGISASKAGFLIAGMEMRLRTYDILAKMQERHGVDMLKGKEAESIGTVINSTTYRGKWGKTGVSPWLKLFWWAPNILKGQWDILTAHTFGYGLDTAFAKKQAFTNLAKVVAEGVAIATIANIIKPGSAETDPTGSEFGTVRIGSGKGSQPFDYTAGSRSMIIAVARTVTGKSKNSQTGVVTDLDKGDFGKATRLTIPARFIMNKVNPPTAVVRDWMKGEFFGGEKFTWLGGFYRMYTPITIQQGIQLKDQPLSGPRIAGVASDFFGVNAPSFDPWKKQRNSGLRSAYRESRQR